MYLLTASQSRQADQEAIRGGIPSLTLMENAGRSAFEIIKKYFPDFAQKKILVIAGKGNNGGDGFVVARYLKKAGADVQVHLTPSVSELSVDAMEMWKRCEKIVGAIHELPMKKFDLIIDAIFGTGLSKEISGPYQKIIEEMNASGKPIVALDIPSGLSADTGKPLGIAVHADLTITMGCPKIGFVQPGAEKFIGKLEVVDIGILQEVYRAVGAPLGAPQWITAEDVRPFFHPRKKDSHKGTYGHVGFFGGEKIGAILLSGRAALRTGSGLVTVTLPQNGLKKISKNFLELMYEIYPSPKKFKSFLENKKAIGIGPGLGVGAGHRACPGQGNHGGLPLQKILENEMPLVLDADALNLLAKNQKLKKLLKKKKSSVIVTPHPAEMARLIQSTTAHVQKNRLQVASAFAREYGVFVVLKGFQTVMATPSGQIFINSTGNPGMATAGMGDVLTGILTSLLGQGLEPEKAMIAGVWIHGRAGDRVAERIGDRGLLASDVIDEIPLVFSEILKIQ